MKRTTIYLAIPILILMLVQYQPAETETPHFAIARMWHGQTPAAKADEYTAYLQEKGITKIQSIPGNLGVQMFRKINQDTADFLVISYWDSVESIKKFAGEDYEKVYQMPRDPEFLINPETKVRHYDVLLNNWSK
ncbi:antibiotic biosynthesis monooxygenase [bacterium]|nr:antibiotic biosynthesis monooxygenase [bacterium]MCI0602954.1 antibiotic biosynthesis monooxygenase [bacterium]